jgi:DNA invertase Pin-like site-specific DNA recombinase
MQNLTAHADDAPAGGLLTPKRDAIYARSATIPQADPSPLVAQIRACEANCAEHGYAVERLYEDAGASGATPYRDGFTRLLRDVARGLVDVVMCADAARLGRERATLQRALTMASQAGARIEVLSGAVLPPALVAVLEEGQP